MGLDTVRYSEMSPAAMGCLMRRPFEGNVPWVLAKSPIALAANDRGIPRGRAAGRGGRVGMGRGEGSV